MCFCCVSLENNNLILNTFEKRKNGVIRETKIIKSEKEIIHTVYVCLCVILIT